jgi:hypothetical protein
VDRFEGRLPLDLELSLSFNGDEFTASETVFADLGELQGGSSGGDLELVNDSSGSFLDTFGSLEVVPGNAGVHAFESTGESGNGLSLDGSGSKCSSDSEVLHIS